MQTKISVSNSAQSFNNKTRSLGNKNTEGTPKHLPSRPNKQWTTVRETTPLEKNSSPKLIFSKFFSEDLEIKVLAKINLLLCKTEHFIRNVNILNNKDH